LLMEDRRLLRELTEQEVRRFAVACVGYPVPYNSETLGEKKPQVCCWRNVS
jgi:hypothetical protein